MKCEFFQNFKAYCVPNDLVYYEHSIKYEATKEKKVELILGVPFCNAVFI